MLTLNHDHYGNVSAQIDYSARSARWHFPALYYSFVEPVGASNQTVQIVMIDTVTLSGDSTNPSTGEQLSGSQYPGPASEAAADAQWDWLNKTLIASTADYLLVAGHFPVWSICEHGPTASLVEKLKPLLEQHRVSAYLAGHDHCAQHIDEGKGVQYHGIGAGILCDASTAHKEAIPAGSLKWHYDAGILGVLNGAFGHVSVDAGGMVVAHYNSVGKKLYEAPPIPPRGKPAMITTATV